MRRIEGPPPVGAINQPISERPVTRRHGVLKPQKVSLVMEARIRGVIDELPPSMQVILDLRYPEDPEDRKSEALVDIGKSRGTTKQNEGRREDRALSRLRSELGIKDDEGRATMTNRNLRKKYVTPGMVARLYKEEGMTVNEIAAQLRTGIHLIRRRLKAAGLQIRPGRPRTEIDRDLLQTLYVDQGLQATKIAELLNLSPSIILKRLKDYGYTVRRSGCRKK